MDIIHLKEGPLDTPYTCFLKLNSTYSILLRRHGTFDMFRYIIGY